MSLRRKLASDGAAVMSYGRQFHIAGAAQRKARDQIFVWDEHGSSCQLSAEDVNARLARDTGSLVYYEGNCSDNLEGFIFILLLISFK